MARLGSNCTNGTPNLSGPLTLEDVLKAKAQVDEIMKDASPVFDSVAVHPDIAEDPTLKRFLSIYDVPDIRGCEMVIFGNLKLPKDKALLSGRVYDGFLDLTTGEILYYRKDAKGVYGTLQKSQV